MSVLIGLAVGAIIAGYVAHVTKSPDVNRVAIRIHRIFEELFVDTLLGKRPDPWEIDWANVIYSRYKFSAELKKDLKSLGYLDYMRCKDYSEDMIFDIFKAPGFNSDTYRTIPHMMRQGFRWNLYDAVYWRIRHSAWYQHTVLKNVKMDRNLEQRWKYEVWSQQPRTGGIKQKLFGEELPPNNYPHHGEKIFQYFPDYDIWFGPSSNDKREWRLEPRGSYGRFACSFYWDGIKTNELPKYWWTIEGPGRCGERPEGRNDENEKYIRK